MHADARVLTLNAGSSSLKVGLFEAGGNAPRRVFAGSIDRIGLDVSDHAGSLEKALALLEPHGGAASVRAVGHRIVHGGPDYASSLLVTPEIVAGLRRLSAIDPDHMPAELAIVEAMTARSPSLPQIACFDTTFHRAMPRVAQLLPIPRRYDVEGLRRYGFHGLSYEFLRDELSRIAGEEVARHRVVMAHLGSGASLSAMREGKCVDTTMSFTPNSGVPMATRSGDIDPGVLLHLQRTAGIDVDTLDDVLSRRSGLLGISESTGDMRDLLGVEATDPRAAEAIAVFCHHVRKAIGAMAATIGGVDTLVFAGGIGENAPRVRWRVAAGLEHLGIQLDAARNDANTAVVSSETSACCVRVIRTNEESIIARDTLRVLELQTRGG